MPAAETLVKYTVDANITGKLGSMGQPVLKSKAKDMEQKFAENMRAAFAAAAPGTLPGRVPAAAARGRCAGCFPEPLPDAV